jgi:hypothetical protein
MRLLGLTFMLFIAFSTGCCTSSAATSVKGTGVDYIMRPVTLKPFTDNHDWMLVRDLTYTIGNTNLSITVPEGFVTDFASIPQALWSLGLTPHGKYSKAAIIHDYLYWSQTCTKKQADNILLIAMKESSVGTVDEVTIYEGVNVGGASSWAGNWAERQSNLPRVVPINYWDFPGDVTWKEYRTSLVIAGVKDPKFAPNSGFCKLGNSSNVPGKR